jgi:prepilin-type N-terminal cleavage/methylation domain-containing protein
MSVRKRERGFTLMEVMVAIVVLSVALMAAGLLATNMTAGTNQSKYMSVAATLASEKLEDLDRWDANNPQVCVPTGFSTEGSLTADIVQTTVCSAGASASVNYYDDVSISLSNNAADGISNCPGGTAGCFAETVSSQSAGSTVYTTTYHSPNGQIVTTAPNATAPGNTTFHRRWLIEANQPVTGVRRLTVLVTLMDSSVQPTVTFQMSMVRP